MTSPAHRLTTTGRWVINLVLAFALYFIVISLPLPEIKWLVALVAFAVLTTLLGSITVSMPSMPALKGGSRLEGSIKWFNGTKGFGFITGDDGNEVFVHFRSVNDLNKREIKPGQRVSYTVAASDRGPQAEDVNAL